MNDTPQITNLIEPLTFGDGLITRYIQRHVCGICLSHLIAFPGPGRMWYARCHEHGNMTATSAVGKGKAAKVKSATTYATRELRLDTAPRTIQDILSELGA